jgi:cystathionine beta-synthase
VDPHGSILAQPEELNTQLTSYKVEGIGYDFIPNVLNRSLVDKWYKSEDKSSFAMSRRLIREEGILCGGSSGTAMVAAIEAAKELGEGQRCVVILPDSVRNYMTKFLNDGWMVANQMMEGDVPDARVTALQKYTVKDLQLPSAVSVNENMACKDAVAVMQKHDFDQLPVVSDTHGIVGVITHGSLLSKIAAGKVTMASPVHDAMFTFKRAKFIEITADSSLQDLDKFFENHHFAFAVTRQGDVLHVDHVVTKVDLLSWLLSKAGK